MRLKRDVWCQCALYKFQKHLDFTNINQDKINDRTSGVLKINRYRYNWIEDKEVNWAVWISVVGLKHGVVSMCLTIIPETS